MKYKLNKLWLNTNIQPSDNSIMINTFNINGLKLHSLINGRYYEYTYNSEGQIINCINDFGVVMYKNEYNDVGDIEKIIMHDELITYSYLDGILYEVTENFKIGRYIYHAGEIDRCEYDDGTISLYEYDEYGNKITIISDKTITYSWEYVNILKY